MYFKYGVYRSFLSRYGQEKKLEIILNSGPDEYEFDFSEIKIPTQIVYYSNVKRANTREELFPITLRE